MLTEGLRRNELMPAVKRMTSIGGKKGKPILLCKSYEINN